MPQINRIPSRRDRDAADEPRPEPRPTPRRELISLDCRLCDVTVRRRGERRVAAAMSAHVAMEHPEIVKSDVKRPIPAPDTPRTRPAPRFDDGIEHPVTIRRAEPARPDSPPRT